MTDPQDRSDPCPCICDPGAPTRRTQEGRRGLQRCRARQAAGPSPVHPLARKIVHGFEGRETRLAGQLEIKIGAFVMITRNLNVAAGVVNGTVGIVQQVHYQHSNGGQALAQIDLLLPGLHDTTRSSALLTRSSFPAARLWGSSTWLPSHSSLCSSRGQGITLDVAQIELSLAVFGPAMAYVAISRLRSYRGLYIIGFDPGAIKADPVALQKTLELEAMAERRAEELTTRLQRCNLRVSAPSK